MNFKAKSNGQKRYLEAILNYDVVVCTGPAGTGKSMIALALALQGACFNKEKKYKQVIITRPLVSVGKDIGALPGSIDERVAPYFRPAYGNMKKLFSPEKEKELKLAMDRGIIVFEPLELMRGMTYDEAFIIIDEAQDTLPEQMIMAITRMGQGSKVVINGDLEQTDIPGTNGLEVAIEAFKNVDYARYVQLSDADQQRNVLINNISKDFKYAEETIKRNEARVARNNYRD